jgi:hypothetical protein
MSASSSQEISRQGLDAAFAADEARKSELILTARLLRAQGQDEAAAANLVQAAELEQELGARCLAAGNSAKGWVHRFSAVGCWAQAGNFYQAIAECSALLSASDVPDRLRQRVVNYRDTLRARRAQWYAELGAEAVA